MKDIKWESSIASSGSFARVGSMVLHCYMGYTGNSNKRWWAVVYMGVKGYRPISGPIRHSLSKSKEDAVRIARELLLDHQAGLAIEMKNFGLEPCFCE